MEKSKALMQLVCACMHTSRLAKGFTHASVPHVSMWRLKLIVSASKHAFWNRALNAYNREREKLMLEPGYTEAL
jgi:hypothetical protein